MKNMNQSWFYFAVSQNEIGLYAAAFNVIQKIDASVWNKQQFYGWSWEW